MKNLSSLCSASRSRKRVSECAFGRLRFLVRALALMPVQLAMSAPVCAVQDELAPLLLIKDVHLPNKKGQGADAPVSLLIKDGVLDLVTADHVPRQEGMRVVHAEGGYLFGKLRVGELANLIIVDEDPVADFEVLLDTRDHAVFALSAGRIVLDTLMYQPEPEPEEDESDGPAWFAYTPPPFALPVDYDVDRKWNHFDGDFLTANFLGVIYLDRTTWSQDSDNESQVGDLGSSDSGELRGMRFGFIGALKFERPWVYTVFGSTNAFDRGFDIDEDSSVSLLDYRLDIPVSESVSLSVGKQKEPISMERLLSLAYNPMQERAAPADGLLPSRNVGVVLAGTVFDQRMTWATGIFNDWFVTGESLNESSTQYVGRVTWAPYASRRNANLLHVGAGLRYDDAKEGVQYQARPEVDNAPFFVGTGPIQAENTTTYEVEASWLRDRLWLAGEYYRTRVSSSASGDPNFQGYHLNASWMLKGEPRAYLPRSGLVGAVPIARPVNAGGGGAVELATRWSQLDLNDGAIAGGNMDIFSLGLTWWLRRDLNFSVNWRHIWLDDIVENGESDAIVVRLGLFLD